MLLQLFALLRLFLRVCCKKTHLPYRQGFVQCYYIAVQDFALLMKMLQKCNLTLRVKFYLIWLSSLIACCVIFATATKQKLTNKAEFCLINHCWSENYATKAFWKENVATPLPSRFNRNILLVEASWWLWIIISHNSKPLRADVDLKWRSYRYQLKWSPEKWLGQESQRNWKC